MHQLQSFLRQHGADNPNAGDISAGPAEAGDKAEFEWVGTGDEDDRNRLCCGLSCKYAGWSQRTDHRYAALHEIGRHCRQRIITICYPPVLDRHVLTFDITYFGKTAAECGIEPHRIGLRQATEISDHRHRRLLRARRERPRRRAAEERDELAAIHSITSSARPMSGSGNARPSVLAVFRLTTNSTFVDCCTGRSAGFSPLRMRPV